MSFIMNVVNIESDEIILGVKLYPSPFFLLIYSAIVTVRLCFKACCKQAFLDWKI